MHRVVIQYVVQPAFCVILNEIYSFCLMKKYFKIKWIFSQLITRFPTYISLTHCTTTKEGILYCLTVKLRRRPFNLTCLCNY